MVVRIAGYGYQKGFGGHFHNDDSIAVLRDIPGLVIASPAHPDDAPGMLRACVEHARATGDVCVYLEPIARYHDGDLHEPGDLGWTAPYDPRLADFGTARLHPATDAPATDNPASDNPASNDADREPADMTIVTFANGVHLSLRAARRLRDDHGVTADVLDLRWLAPLPRGQILDAARQTGRVLVVDETRRTGGVGEGIVAELVDADFDGRLARVSSRDSFVPLGAAAELVLVSVDDIVTAARRLLR